MQKKGTRRFAEFTENEYQFFWEEGEELRGPGDGTAGEIWKPGLVY